MLKFLSVFTLLVLLLAACGGDEKSTVNPTLAPAPTLRVTVNEAVVLAIPSRDAAILFRLLAGDELPILAKTPPDLLGVVWYQVVQGEAFGWIAGSQVEISGDLNQVITVPESVWAPTSTPLAITFEPAATFTPETTPQALIELTEVTLYDTPSTASASVGRLVAGEKVDILGRTNPNAQIEIFLLVGRTQRVLGWVLSSQVTIEGDIMTIQVVEDVSQSLANLLPETTPLPTSDPITPTITPTVQVTLTTIPLDSSETAPLATTLATFTPQFTPNLAATSQFAPTATEIITSPTPSPEVLFSLGVAPPLSLDVPEGWQVAHLSIPINNAYLQGNLPVSIYRGELANGATGTLWLIWAFPNVTSPSGEINLYADGVQLLRSMVFDPISCNIGLGDEPLDYEVGNQPAVGTIFSAVDCTDQGDIAGFFAALQVAGVNYAFYAGVEPIDRVVAATPELQAILDTVQFETP